MRTGHRSRAVRRLLRRGGRAVFSEPDWDTLVVDCADLSTARVYRAFVVVHLARNACVGWRLRALVDAAGLTTVRVLASTAVFDDVGSADRVLGFRRVTDRAVSSGYLGRDDADDWLDQLLTRPFFASVTLFTGVAERPD